MADRPLVRVGSHGLLGEWERATCSVCGLLGELPWSLKGVHLLHRLAHRHTRDVHDGDVVREGWA